MVWNIFSFTHIPGEMIQFDEHIFPMGWNHHLAHRFIPLSTSSPDFWTRESFYGCFSFKLSLLGNKMKPNLGCPPCPIIAIVEGINYKNKWWCLLWSLLLGRERNPKQNTTELSGRVAKDNITVSLGRWPWKKHRVELWLNYSLLGTKRSMHLKITAIPKGN